MLSLWSASLCTQAVIRFILVIIFMLPNASYSIQPIRLNDCPDKPNCVSSMTTSKKHFTEPLTYPGSATEAWRVVTRTVMSLPRCKLIKQSDRYLHFEVTSRIFRFTDDLELLLEANKNEIQIRSGSRTGYGDFGVNRRRVEMIRKLFFQNLDKPGSE